MLLWLGMFCFHCFHISTVVFVQRTDYSRRWVRIIFCLASCAIFWIPNDFVCYILRNLCAYVSLLGGDMGGGAIDYIDVLTK